MPELFFSVITNLGLQKYTAADTGGPIVDLAEFAVGDSNGVYSEPDAAQVGLVNELWRGAVNAVYVSPNNVNWMVVEALIPVADGGFDIREAGIFNAAGDLIAVAKYPLTTKPAVGSGSEKDLYVRLIFERSNAGAVTQEIDPSLVTATKEYVDTRDWRESVRAATTDAIDDLAAGAPDALDGVALAQGDRILVKDQADAAENGIYIVQTLGTGADGEWIRSADADTGLDVSASFSVAVEEGTVNADSLWMLTTNQPIDLGVTLLAFGRMAGVGELDTHISDTDNPHEVTVAQIIGMDGLIGGSFEVDSNGDGEPDGWIRTVYQGGSVERTVTPAEVMHGAAGEKFVRPAGAGNGGGDVLSNFIPISSGEGIALSFLRKMSIDAQSGAGFKHIVRLHFYDAAKIALAPAGEGTSYITLADSTLNHVTEIMCFMRAIALAGARFYRIEFIGGDTDTDVAGTMLLDGVSIERTAGAIALRGEKTINDFISMAVRSQPYTAVYVARGPALNFDLRSIFYGQSFTLILPFRAWCTAAPGAGVKWYDEVAGLFVSPEVLLPAAAAADYESVLTISAASSEGILQLTPWVKMDNGGDTIYIEKTADTSIRVQLNS